MRCALRHPGRAGFTLIELMVVVAIIGILAAIAIPKFADLIRKAKEGTTQGDLGAIRSALAIYYGQLDGNFPVDDLTSLAIQAKFVHGVPQSSTPFYHNDSTLVTAGSSFTAVLTDAGGWGYVNNFGSGDWGNIWVNCTHTDSKGNFWSSY